MKYKVIVYYDNMEDSEHIFNNRYTVRIKGIDDNYKFLNYGTSFKDWTFDDGEGAKGVRVAHTTCSKAIYIYIRRNRES